MNKLKRCSISAIETDISHTLCLPRDELSMQWTKKVNWNMRGNLKDNNDHKVNWRTFFMFCSFRFSFIKQRASSWQVEIKISMSSFVWIHFSSSNELFIEVWSHENSSDDLWKLQEKLQVKQCCSESKQPPRVDLKTYFVLRCSCIHNNLFSVYCHQWKLLNRALRL